MSKTLCQRCYLTLRRKALGLAPLHNTIQRRYTQSPPSKPTDVAALLSKPSWSVTSLLPHIRPTEADRVTPTQLSHLLRLSALPQPKSELEAQEMINTLESQLHFVRDIQSVDTEGIEPLEAIRDETSAAVKEKTITVETLKDALADEQFVGTMKRPRRRRDVPVDTEGVEDWDVLGCAERKVGRYFVVDDRDR